jgi:PAS domain S-box-containing protein
MASGPLRRLDPGLYQRGQYVTALMRWMSLGACLSGTFFIWNEPRTRPLGCLAVLLGYGLFAFPSYAWQRRHPRDKVVKTIHAVVDAFALFGGAAFSGAIDSPVWLLLYPHVMTVSVRGGLPLGVVTGILDGLLVMGLNALTPGGNPLALPHAFALLLCAIMGGVTSTYLKQIRTSLRETNLELSSANQQLSETLTAEEAARSEQERAMQQLRDSEERYRLLLEGIQDGVLILQDGRVTYANEVFASMIGETPQALVGGDYRDFSPPEDRKDLSERYLQWETNQSKSGGFEARLRTRTGDTLLVSVRAGSVVVEGRRVVITTIRDITRERRMEAEVKAHAERLAAINEIANAVNLSLTIEDIFKVAAEETRRLVPFDRLTIALLEEGGPAVEVVAVGPRARRLRASFGREAVAWAFKRPISWCAGGEEPAPPQLSVLLADAGVHAIATVPLLSKDRVIGSMNLGRLKAQPFSTWDLGVMEPVARHIAIALDNARLLEAVRRRSREFESVLEIGRGIVERLDLGELLPLVTRSVNRVMGTEHCLLMLRSGDRLNVVAQEGLEADVLAEVGTLKVGESLSGWVALEGRPLAVANFRDDPQAGFKEIAERFGYVSYLGVPLKRGPEVLGTLEVITKQQRRFDAQEQELMAAFAAQAAVAIENARLFETTRSHVAQVENVNRRLEELDRMRQQYLRNVSHEFRTPLTVIKGYAEYLQDADPQDERALRDVMRIIVESCDRVIDMVDTLIEVSRVEQGAEQTLQVQQLDLREVATSSVDQLRHVAARKQIALALDFPGEPLRLFGDAGLLHQLVRKLVDNALKYSPSGGRVVVRGRLDGEALTFEVEDFGIGIPPEHLPRIFEKFYMVDGGIARRVGGTGVGLYLVREIVRLHNGTVDVRSLPGQGSVFSVRLPREPRGQRETALA